MTVDTRQRQSALSEPVGECEGPCGRTLALRETVVYPVELESGRTVHVTLCRDCAPNETPERGT